MTVATTQTAEEWTGDASSATFPIPFPFLSRDHLVVWKEDALGAQTPMVISSATGEGESSGGSITLTEPVGVGYTLHVRRSTPKTQETDYVPHDPFPADSHERALDKLTMIVQELIASGVFGIDSLRILLGDSTEIAWTVEGGKMLGELVWPLRPPIGDYIDAPGSMYQSATGGHGYGSDTLTAKASDGSDTRHGLELAHSGSAGTARVGNLDGTRLEYAQNVGGEGVHARGVGAHAFDGLIAGELADAEADSIRPATIGVGGRIGTASPADFRDAIDAVNIAGDTMTGGLTLTSLVNSATAGVGIRPKVALADGTDAVQDAATFRGTIGAARATVLSDYSFSLASPPASAMSIPGLASAIPGADAISVDISAHYTPGVEWQFLCGNRNTLLGSLGNTGVFTLRGHISSYASGVVLFRGTLFDGATTTQVQWSAIANATQSFDIKALPGEGSASIGGFCVWLK